MIERYFTKGEQDYFYSLSLNERLEFFFRQWTSREAFMKGRGDGLQLSLKRFELKPITNKPQKFRIQWESETGSGEDWTLEQLTPAVGYVGAVVFKADENGKM